MKDADKFRFLCKFVLEDFEGMRKGDWLNFLEDLNLYFGGYFRVMDSTPKGVWVNLDSFAEPGRPLLLPVDLPETRQEAKGLAKEVASLVFNYLQGREELYLGDSADDPEEAWNRLFTIKELEKAGLVGPVQGFSAHITVEMTFPWPGGLQVDGNIRDLLLWDVYRLLDTREAQKLLICPQCRKVPFFKVGRQKHCSRRCAVTSAKAAYAKREAEKNG